MSYKIDKKSRRAFLVESTGFMMSIPFLTSLMSPEAIAQATTNRKRFLFTTYAHGGLWNSNFFPSSATENGKMTTQRLFAGNSNLPSHTIRHGNLASMVSRIDGVNKLSRALPGELNLYLNQMNLIRGVDIPIYMGHHRTGHLGNLNGNVNGSKDGLTSMPTIDQILAYSSSFYDNKPAFRYINTHGSGCTNFLNPSQFGGTVRDVPQDAGNPRSLYHLLFGTNTRFRAEQKVVDRTLEAYRRLRRNPRLSTEDRNKLDKTMEDYFELESRLSYYSNFASSTSMQQAAGSADSFVDRVDYRPTAADAMRADSDYARLFALAFKTGATKVINHKIHKYLNSFNSNGDWHGHAHDYSSPEAQGGLLSHAQNTHIHFTRRLLDELNVPEAGGRTYLDNSLIYIVPENSMTHSCHNNHIVTFGSAGGALHTGRYIDYSNRENGSRVHAEYDSNRRPLDNDNYNNNGVLMNRLWVSFLQAMGLSPSDYEGINRKGTTNSYGDFFNEKIEDTTRKYDISSIDRPLPLLYRG